MESQKKINIAILGYGTVGSGVAEVITTNQNTINKNSFAEINIKYILDLREFPSDPMKNLFTKEFDDILNDDSVEIVVEVMGGLNPSYNFVKQLLEKGKSVVTSNKELVATHGVELLDIAKNKNVNFLFEASVGGGIPIIRPFNQCLSANDVEEISGIVNGTTNYILSEMTSKGLSFEVALKDAQDKGYAEKNPDADVLGYDACRKIAILSSLATGRQIDFNEVDTVGITHITSEDIEYAKAMDANIKLIASAKLESKTSLYARVEPVIIPRNHPLFMVEGVFNAVFIKGNMVGDLMFYGSGAGKLPTASAVVADIIQVARACDNTIPQIWDKEVLHLKDIKDMKVIKFIRIEYSNKEESLSEVKKLFGDIKIIEVPTIKNEFAFVTNIITENDFRNKLDDIEKSSHSKVVNTIAVNS